MHISLIDSAPFKIPNKDEQKAVYYIFSFSALTYLFYIVLKLWKALFLY